MDRRIGKVLKDFLVDKILMKKINFIDKMQFFCCLINDDIFVAVL